MKKQLFLLSTLGCILFCRGVGAESFNSWDRLESLKTIYKSRATSALEVLISKKIKNAKKRKEIITLINRESKKYNIDPIFIATLIYVESSFNVFAKSSAGAIGLMQVLPNTGRMIAARTGTLLKNISDLYKPHINIKFGVWYIQKLLKQFNDPLLAITAYNYGPGNVRKFQRIYENFPRFPYMVKIERIYSNYLKELSILNSLVKAGLVSSGEIKYKL